MFKISNENKKVIAVSGIKKYDEELRFTIPILALCFCIILIKYNFKYIILQAIPKIGIDYCLVCYYQKFGFQPIGNEYTVKSFLDSFENAKIVFGEIYDTDTVNKYKPFNIMSCDMTVDRETLSKNIYNMLNDNDICKKFLIL